MPGKLPNTVSNLTTDEIEEYASKLGKEEEVLASLGCTPNQVERAKKNHRWRKHWDIGYNKGLVKKAKDMFDSDEPSVLKLYADKIVPKNEEGIREIHIKAPKWFYKELEIDKIKSARRSV